MQPALHISLFGSFSAQAAGRPIAGFATDKIRALLAYLAVEPDRPHARSVLATLFWPEYADGDAMRNLRQSLYRLRLALDGTRPDAFATVFEVNRHSVMLRRAQVEVDVLGFDQLLDRCQHHDHAQEDMARCGACLADLEAAAALYRGEFLQGIHLPDADPFVEWQTIQRERLHHRALTALQQLATAYGELGDYQAMHRHASRQVALEPWREEAHQQVMQALALSGRRSEALAQYERCSQILADELGVEPSDQTTGLYSAIRSGRLRAPAQPVPQRSPGAPAFPEMLHNLPPFYTPVLGREAETEQVIAYLTQGWARLVSLTGAGGSGKTRLAAHIARQLAAVERDSGQASRPPFPDGIFFSPLVAVKESALLPSALAGFLGLQLTEGTPPRQQVLNYVRGKSLLLILDNFEHLMDSTELLAALLAEAPGLALLVTSRLPLNLMGEQRFRVEGLTYAGDGDAVPPDAKGFLAYSGHRLFVQTARLVQPGFDPTEADRQAIAEICRLVLGSPLALEIAAAWVRLLECRQIASDIRTGLDFLTTPMRDVPERHRSIRAVFDQTWQHLGAAERRVVAQLSIFRGDFTLEAMLAVTDADVLIAANLLDWSLLQRAGGQRYVMHELFRHYAEEQLTQMAAEGSGPSPATVLAGHHSHYYLNLVAGSQEQLYGPDLPQVQDRLRQSIGNIRRAWQWAVQQEEFQDVAHSAAGFGHVLSLLGEWWEGEKLMARAAEAVAVHVASGRAELRPLHGWLAVQQGRFLMACGQIDGALTCLNSALDELAGAPGEEERRWYGHALNTHADLMRLRGDYGSGMADARAALEQFRSLRDRSGQAQSLNRLGQILWHQADYGQALAYQQEALTLEEALEHPRGISQCLSSIGLIYYKQSRYEEALVHHQKALAIARALENPADQARHLSNLGVVHSDRREHEPATAYFEQALAIDRTLGNRLGIAIRQTNLGMIYWQQGHFEKGLDATQEAHRILVEIGHRSGVAIALGNMGVIYWLMGRLDASLAHHQQALDLDEALGNWDCVARHLSNMGVVQADAGRDAEAMGFYERGWELHQKLNIPYYLCELMVRKAHLHLQRGEIDRAEELNRKGLALALEIGRPDTLFEGRLLAARLTGREDPAQAAKMLADLARGDAEAAHQAAVQYEVWLLRGDGAAARDALRHYEQAYARVPNARYGRRIEELTQALAAGG